MSTPTTVAVPRERLEEVCRKHGVQELLIFGSAAAGEAREASDIDLLVSFRPEARAGFLTLSRVQRDLEALFGRRVDLVPKGGLKPAIRNQVLASARVLYAA